MVRVVAFGTGHFLRGYWFPFVAAMNVRTGWGGRVTVVKPTPGALGAGAGLPRPRRHHLSRADRPPARLQES